MITYEQALALKERYKPVYAQRHHNFRRLRDFWHGRYWDDVDSEANGLANLFRDLRTSKKDIGPDFRLVHNIIQEVCVKYQSYLSPLPMIRVPTDADTDRGREQATRRERFLYGCWGENDMNQVLNRIAWYTPLMGDCFLGIWPDLERNVPRTLLRSPEYAFPIQDSEGFLGAVLFCWEVPESVAKRDFPSFTPPARKPGRFRRATGEEPKVEILEYSDRGEFARWVDGQKVNGVEHDFGFNLFEQIPFINVPDEPWNHGAVEQAVNLNLAENALRSLLFQAVLDNVFPAMVLENPYKAPETIERGPGAVIPVHEGGSVSYLTPPVQALPVQVGFMSENERAIKQATSMPDVNFGQTNASIITGKAINELQGAGSGSLVEMVQGTGAGAALSKWNSKAIILAQRMFREDRLYLEGFYNESIYDLNPKSFAFKSKGSEIVGSPRNEVIFSPYLNMHEKLVMNLQAMGGGLVSKQYAREQIGIPDSQAMQEEIFQEQVDDAVMAAFMAAVEQAGTDANAVNDLEEQFIAYVNGETTNLPALGAAPAPAASPLPPTGGEGSQGPPVASLPGGGQALSPALMLPPGSPPPVGGPGLPPVGGPAPGLEEGISLDEAVTAFQGVQGIVGRVFLTGEIVGRGTTDDDIEVALTEGQDRQTLADGLPQYAGLLAFSSVEAEPQERFIEVTPGAEALEGGAEADLSDIIEDEDELEVA